MFRLAQHEVQMSKKEYLYYFCESRTVNLCLRSDGRISDRAAECHHKDERC